MTTQWIAHSKKFAKDNDMAYGDALRDDENRNKYYEKGIDKRKTKNKVLLKELNSKRFMAGSEMKSEICIQIKRSMAGKEFDSDKKSKKSKKSKKIAA